MANDDPGGPGISTVTEPSPLGMLTVWLDGSPDPTCRKSRIIRSSPARTVLFMVETDITSSLPFITLANPPSVAPMIMVSRPIEVISSTSE